MRHLKQLMDEGGHATGSGMEVLEIALQNPEKSNQDASV